MIQANELRIGNILEYFVNENGVDWIKVKVNGWDILRCDDNPTSFNGVRRPVVLTPEILERAGFKTPDGYNSTVLYKNGLMIDYHMGKYKVRDHTLAPCDYLHQLQNLFFALCGTELDINLNL
jgi:hypothetical protein